MVFIRLSLPLWQHTHKPIYQVLQNVQCTTYLHRITEWTLTLSRNDVDNSFPQLHWISTRIPVLATNKRLFASWNSLYELLKENFSFHTFGVHTLQYHVVRVKCYATNWLRFYFRRMEYFGIFWSSFIHAHIILNRLQKNRILQIFSSVALILEIPFLFGLRPTTWLRCS